LNSWILIPQIRQKFPKESAAAIVKRLGGRSDLNIAIQSHLQFWQSYATLAIGKVNSIGFAE
jgi:hypothetical protein